MPATPPTNFPDSGPDLTPLIYLFFAGIVVLGFGRMTQSRMIQVAGITMVVVATFAVPILAFLVYR